MGMFTVERARAELERLRPMLVELVVVRADAAELAAALASEQGGGPTGALRTPRGGVPELKAAQARLDEMLTDIRAAGVDVKGFAPLLLDFPAELDGETVLLCWLEGEPSLDWYHRPDLGFMGRRRLP
jgi:arsenite methyltransferase